MFLDFILLALGFIMCMIGWTILVVVFCQLPFVHATCAIMAVI